MESRRPAIGKTTFCDFGGAIPRQFVPAVGKGIQESAARGYLAGYPVVDFRAIVYDGSYHDVDSSEMTFKLAGRLAFRAAMEQAKPALLEPIIKVEIEAPDEFVPRGSPRRLLQVQRIRQERNWKSNRRAYCSSSCS